MNFKKDSSENKGMILVVDDIPENIKILGEILKNQGYSIAVATNGQETFEILDHQLPDLILLDIMLPDIDGFEICKRLKQNKKTWGIPVIFLTAMTDLNDKIRGFEVGAVDYITKPFEEIEVAARVRTHVQLKISEDIIRTYCEELEKSNKTKDKIFSIIAHDLRNPISNFYTLINLMKEGELDEGESKKFFQYAEKAIDGAMYLLNNLFEWAASQQNSIIYKPQTTDMAEVIGENINISEVIASNKGITLKSEIHSPVFAFADKNMMMTVIRNLISNAIKFTHEGGEINISASAKENDIEIAVKDNGIGIEENDIEKLFTIDQNIVRLGTSEEKGTGLGLLLCKEFIEKNRGRIWVESKVGKGTGFYFTVPKSEE